jgi:outer membrane protein
MASRSLLTNLLPVLTLTLALAVPATAQQGDWQGGMRLVSMSPDSQSNTFVHPGDGVDRGTVIEVDDSLALDLHLRYRLHRDWDVELSLLASRIDLTTAEGSLGGLDAGSVWMTPLTVTMLYQVPLRGKIRPYLGAGLCYTHFFAYDVSGDMRGLGAEIELDPSVGPAGQLGVAYEMNERWQINLDVRYLGISSDIEIELASGIAPMQLDIDPLVIGIGIQLWY